MSNKSVEREKFGSRLGFILISAGCAIGLGNIWRFPYIVSQYGGASFILIYLLFLVMFGLPIMSMEFAVGRASQKSIAKSFSTLEPKNTKWHWFSAVGACGNYLLMMFYTVVTAWLFIYFYKTIAGDFIGQSVEQVTSQFAQVQQNPILQILVTALVVVLGFFICSLGLKKGVEKINKIMMLGLLAIIVVLAVYVCTLPGASKGIEYYLVPNLHNLVYDSEGKFRLGEAIFAALGQAFFTLSIGMGSMAIFGSYIKKDRSLLGESLSIAALDTGVAFIAGLIIIPATFVFEVKGGDTAGPGLIFETLPNIFNNIWGGPVLGALFFLLMIFAAMSTVTAVFENIIAFGMDKWGWSRKKSCLINCLLMLVLVLPCILGFNLLSGFTPLGPETNIMDLEDFIISNNILPLGSLVYVLFCTLNKKGWGWNNYLEEANAGKGLKMSNKLKVYCKYIIPILLVVFYIYGIISKFLPA
ncbi:MAG: sodium-dependent transporter [Clostridiales bacterium]|nr:sodium-dependent transporter [Clostridiales bacterium]